MKLRRIVTAALAATALLTGCGGTSYASADDVIADVQEVLPECGDVEDATSEWDIQEAKSCSYTQGDGRSDAVTAFMFRTEKKQRNWVEFIEGLTDNYYHLIEGDGWVVGLLNRTNAEALAEQLDGELR